jgi:hypothetical protein
MILVGMQNLQFRIKKFAPRNSDIYLAGAHAVVNPAGDHVSQHKRHPGICSPEAIDDAGKQAGRERRQSCYPHDAVLSGRERARIDDNRIEFVEYALKNREKLEADPGKFNSSTITIQQFDLEVFFKLFDLDSKSRLRDVQQPRRARKAFEVRNRNERTYLPQVYIHNHTLLLLSEQFNCKITGTAFSCGTQLLQRFFALVLRSPSGQQDIFEEEIPCWPF